MCSLIWDAALNGRDSTIALSQYSNAFWPWIRITQTPAIIWGICSPERGERLTEAKKLIERALKIDPENGAYLDSLGWVYYQLKQYENAARWLDRALTVEEETLSPNQSQFPDRRWLARKSRGHPRARGRHSAQNGRFLPCKPPL